MTDEQKLMEFFPETDPEKNIERLLHTQVDKLTEEQYDEVMKFDIWGSLGLTKLSDENISELSENELSSEMKDRIYILNDYEVKSIDNQSVYPFRLYPDEGTVTIETIRNRPRTGVPKAIHFLYAAIAAENTKMMQEVFRRFSEQPESYTPNPIAALEQGIGLKPGKRSKALKIINELGLKLPDDFVDGTDFTRPQRKCNHALNQMWAKSSNRQVDPNNGEQNIVFSESEYLDKYGLEKKLRNDGKRRRSGKKTPAALAALNFFIDKKFHFFYKDMKTGNHTFSIGRLWIITTKLIAENNKPKTIYIAHPNTKLYENAATYFGCLPDNIFKKIEASIACRDKYVFPFVILLITREAQTNRIGDEENYLLKFSRETLMYYLRLDKYYSNRKPALNKKLKILCGELINLGFIEKREIDDYSNAERKNNPMYSLYLNPKGYYTERLKKQAKKLPTTSENDL